LKLQGTQIFYREAVASQSPGLFQPWVAGGFVEFNPERVASTGATALRLDLHRSDPRLKQPWALRRNRFAVTTRTALHLGHESATIQADNHMEQPKPTRLIVGITGATGTIFGVRLLQLLHGSGVETHLVLSNWGARTLVHETSYTVKEVQQLATKTYSIGEQGAAISSGSFVTMGMVVAPCSMRTVAAIAHGLGDNLIHRAADVVLKERRKLVLVARESPLSEIHLENLLKLARMGVVILPPVPAFYNSPQNLDDIVNHIAMRVIDQFDIHLDVMNRWDGVMLDQKRSQSDVS
jgi:4-hydroxy-3-polyprenylbenzoate decarboxylase